jgi:outer membrane protein assembly factor BamE
MIARHYHAASAARPLAPIPIMTNHRLPSSSSFIRWLAAGMLAIAVMLTGCVHRVPIPQGNFLKKDDLDKITVGMTRVQVRAVLGTPMVADPFETDRWDYVFYIKQGERYTYRQHHVIVHFDAAEKVERIDRPQDADEPSPTVLEESPRA